MNKSDYELLRRINSPYIVQERLLITYPQSEFDRLLSLGYIERNPAGSYQITAQGLKASSHHDNKLLALGIAFTLFLLLLFV